MKNCFRKNGEIKMYSGTVIKPYWGFGVGEKIYIKESDLTFKWCANLYRTKELSSFVVTVWDIDMFRECVRF